MPGQRIIVFAPAIILDDRGVIGVEIAEQIANTSQRSANGQMPLRTHGLLRVGVRPEGLWCAEDGVRAHR
jgi:hypothetical protein